MPLFFLIDGLSKMEEKVVGCINQTLVKIPMFGGPAGDDLRFRETFIYKDGEFTSNSAVVTIFRARNWYSKAGISVDF